MKIATYNVNGVIGRLPVLLRWLKEDKPHIVCLQELKTTRLVTELMAARRAVKEAANNDGQVRDARMAVDAANVALGERGPVWWTDGAPDLNRHMAKTTPYGKWYQQQTGSR